MDRKCACKGMAYFLALFGIAFLYISRFITVLIERHILIYIKSFEYDADQPKLTIAFSSCHAVAAVSKLFLMQNVLYENKFHFHNNELVYEGETHFHINSFTRKLVLTLRFDLGKKTHVYSNRKVH